MLRIPVLAMILCGALPAMAQIMTTGPLQFSVTGVAADDVLNIRAAPNASAEIIGSFAPDQRGIEILERSESGSWGLVGLPEGNGWVSMHYLNWTENRTAGVPRPLRCFGTEPFWQFRVEGDKAHFDTPAGAVPGLNILREGEAQNGMFVFSSRSAISITVIAQNGICYNGMSDRRYGLQATLLYEDQQTPQVFNGCCTTDGNF